MNIGKLEVVKKEMENVGIHTYLHTHTHTLLRSIIRSRWHEYEIGHKTKKRKENDIGCDYNLVVIESIKLK
jgi:hypothetical protein